MSCSLLLHGIAKQEMWPDQRYFGKDRDKGDIHGHDQHEGDGSPHRLAVRTSAIWVEMKRLRAIGGTIIPRPIFTTKRTPQCTWSIPLRTIRGMKVGMNQR